MLRIWNIAAIQANQGQVRPVPPMLNYSTQQPSSTVVAPNLANSASLPTYDYNSTIQPTTHSPNFQTRTPQPMHNNRLRSFGEREQTAPMQPVATPAAAIPRQQTPATSPSTQPQPSSAKVNAQQNPAPAIPATQSNSVAPNKSELTTPSQPIPAPTVSNPAKPDIMNNDNALHQPKIDDATDDGSMIDIKLH